MRLPARGAQVALLRCAADLGIRWFDTAPLYGLGRAEPVLAQALRGRTPDAARSDLAVVTKVGLRPSAAARVAASVQAPVRAAVRGRARLNAALKRVAAGTAAPFRLTADTVAASVGSSARRLAPLPIDALLLHDVPAEEIEEPALGALLELRNRGVVRRLGAAGDARLVRAVLDRFPGVFQVAQVPGGPENWDLSLPPGVERVSYGCLARGLGPVVRWLAGAPEERTALEEAWSGRLDGAGAVARLLVQAELVATEGVVLVGTTEQAHLRDLWVAATEVAEGRSTADWPAVRRLLGAATTVPDG